MRFRVSSPLFVLMACAGLSLAAQSPSTRGPARGSLVLEGGVGGNAAIDAAFLALAGGPTSRVVVIPTASGPDILLPEMAAHIERRMKERFGVSTVTVLHTRDRAEADADRYLEALRRTTGVWILGGFPERLIQAYLGTKTQRAIKELVDRGGVVGGESAGAMILASWLDTTGSEFTPDIRALVGTHGPGGGFGFLTQAAIFPHFNSRGPIDAVKESAAHPGLLAIGIDEETALIVKGEHAEVVGPGTVSMHDAAGRGGPVIVVLRSGDRYDLAARRKQEQTPPPRGPGGPAGRSPT